MLQVWEMEAYPCGDMRLPHHVFPPKFIPNTQLLDLASVHLFKVDLDDTMAMKKRLTLIKNDWKVCSADVVTLEKSLGCGLEDKLKEMCEPAESTEDSVLLVLEGEMYYDVEFDDDKWVRVLLRRGDLIVVPKGSYYRTTLTPTNFVKLQRFNKQQNQMVVG
uniref:1,2-dihydroxy-3-keto-5-methylthiopentene dioxygenase n=1 Tax=Globodera pallida TaxID=36090 RepID=A0A183CF11_GLOPA